MSLSAKLLHRVNECWANCLSIEECFELCHQILPIGIIETLYMSNDINSMDDSL